MIKENLPANNEKLLQLLTDNDAYAFTEIYSRFRQKLFSIAYNRLREIQSAEDIVQDVFASLWANRRKSTIGSLDNYLATAASYLAVARIKKRTRERIYNRSVLQVPLFDIPIESSLHYKKVLEVVNNEIERLPLKCRLVFKYSRNDGMPVKQIARQMSISPKTVENHLHKALKQLNGAMQNFLASS